MSAVDSPAAAAEEWRPRRARWPWAVVAVLLVAAGVLVWQVAFVVRTQPARVVILVESEGADGQVGASWRTHGDASAKLAEVLGKSLEKLGLDVVPVRTPEALKAVPDTNDPDQLRTAARRLGARWAIVGRFRVVGADGNADARLGDRQKDEFLAEAELVLIDTDSGARTAVTAAPLRRVVNAASAGIAMPSAAEGLATDALGPLAAAFSQADGMAAFNRPESELASDNLSVARKLEGLFSRGRAYRRRVGPQPPRPGRAVVLAGYRLGERTLRWWEDRSLDSERLSQAIGGMLERLGVDVAPAGAPALVEALKGAAGIPALRAAARALGITALVTVTLQPLAAVPVERASAADHRVGVQVSVVDTEDSGAEQPVEGVPPTASALAASPGMALREVASRLPELLRGPVAAALVAAPSLAVLAGGEGITRDQAEARAGMKRLFEVAEAVRTVRRRRARRAKERPGDGEAEKGTRPRPLTPYEAEDYVIGTAADGRLILMSEARHLIFDEAGAVRVTSEQERFDRLARDGTSRETLLELYNIFSWPSVSLDGRVVAFVSDDHGYGKSLREVPATGGAPRTVLGHPSHYFSAPVVSPDGGRIAFFTRETRRGANALDVVGADGGGRKTLIDRKATGLSVPSWTPDGQALYLAARLPRPGEALEPGAPRPEWSIWRVDVATGERRPVLGPAARPAPDPADEPAEEGEGAPARPVRPKPTWFDRVAVAPSGGFLVVSEGDDDGGRWIGRYTLPAGPYSRLLAGVAVQRFLISPDSRTVALQAKGRGGPTDPVDWDAEVGVLSAAGGPVTVLTLNGREDELAAWARDGKELYITRSGMDQDDRRRPTVRVLAVTVTAPVAEPAPPMPAPW